VIRRTPSRRSFTMIEYHSATPPTPPPRCRVQTGDQRTLAPIVTSPPPTRTVCLLRHPARRRIWTSASSPPPPVPAFGMFAFLAFLLGVATTCTCIGSDPTPKLKTLGQADDEASKVAVWAALVGVTRASGRDPRSFIPSLVTGCGDWSSALRAPAEEEDRPRIRCTYTTKARGDDNVVEFTRARCGDAACWAFPKGDQTAVLMQGSTLTIYKPPPRKYSTRPSTNTSLPFAALARLQGALGRWIRPVLRDFFFTYGCRSSKSLIAVYSPSAV